MTVYPPTERKQIPCASSEESHGATAEEPLGLSADRVDDVLRGYFERIAVGQPLPDMPIFITPTHYLNVPLE